MIQQKAIFVYTLQSKKRVSIVFKKKNPSKKSFNKIIINSWAANQHLRMISKGSRDTEDWSNDAELQGIN